MNVPKNTKNLTDSQIKILRKIPALETILSSPELEAVLKIYPREMIAEALRTHLEDIRSKIISGVDLEKFDESELSSEAISAAVAAKMEALFASPLKRVVNVSGTVTHTNLGRALLSDEACSSLIMSSKNYVNLEYDIASGERGHRDAITEGLLRRLTGGEASTVVNNNAAAVLICLNTLAAGKEVIVSRGELIEIGGAFRIPEVMAASGAILKEVGSTNRTRASDYLKALSPNTALLLKVHPSNYKILGFTESVEISEIVRIGGEHSLPTMEDLGSGALVDLTQYGLPYEPVVKERIQAGVDLVTFSGDKLLGGPQAGIIVGKRKYIEAIRKNPLMRALRVGKITIAALEATLRLHLDPERLPERMPMLRFYTRSLEEIKTVAEKLCRQLQEVLGDRMEVCIEDGKSQIGSGSLPVDTLPTKCISLFSKDLPAEQISEAFRRHTPPIIGRVKAEKFIMDLRTATEEDVGEIVKASVKLKVIS